MSNPDSIQLAAEYWSKIIDLTAQLEASQNARKIAESDLANLKSMIAATPNGCKVIDAAMARISVLQGDRPSVSLAAYEAVSQAMYKMEKERDQWKKTAENAANEFMLEQKLHNETGLKLEASRKEVVRLREALVHYVDVVSSLNDPNDFTPKVKDEGHYAREALASTTTDLVWEHNWHVEWMKKLPVAAWMVPEGEILLSEEDDYPFEVCVKNGCSPFYSIPELKEVKE